MRTTTPTTWRPWCLALLLAVLGGCGGGDAEEAADASLQPVKCNATPQVCE